MEDGQLIEACKPKQGRSFDYGYGNLITAGIYEKDGKTPLKMNVRNKYQYTFSLLLNQEETKQFEMKIDQTYHIKAKFDVKKFSPFGAYPKYFGIKVTEKFTSADPNTKRAFEVSLVAKYFELNLYKNIDILFSLQNQKGTVLQGI